MARYTAIEPLLTKAGRVEPGEFVELSAAQAKPLLEMSAIEPHKGRGRSSSEEAEAKREAAEKAAAEAVAAEKAAEATRQAAEAAESKPD